MLSYLGFCNYYRALIPHFAELAGPLYRFGQAVKINWTPEIERAFDALHQALINSAILCLPDPPRPFILEIDASAVAVGDVLKQSAGKGE